MATQQQNERLAALVAAGTSPWLDQIRRGLIESGELRRMIEEESLRGVTSNPSIFEKAILGSDEYDEQLEELARQGLDARGIYQGLAIKDIQDACDVLRTVYDATDGHDGYVSFEVDPDIAFDTERTMEQAREYWARVDRPNVMIKIPGTDEGIPAIEQMTYEGRNINITLLFSVKSYERVIEAYLRGIERRLQEGKPVDRINSVASFFVSRVDTEVDKRLEALDRRELQGKAGLANARLAYQRFKGVFLEGERFAAMRRQGANLQRPLWASTGTKNPAYPDTMYVDGLIAPHTVNTMPLATLNAVADHGRIEGATADQDPTTELEALAGAGIDLDDVTAKLLRDGVTQFVTPMEKLLTSIESMREGLVTSRPATIETSLPDELEPAIAQRVAVAEQEQVAKRIWKKDDTLWGPAGQPEVADRLGWLTIAECSEDVLDDLEAFAREVAAEGTRDVVLLGMGGSSLAPEVIRQSFGEVDGRPRLHVLDSTDAGAIAAVQAQIDPQKTLFLVSTKSGGTIETLSLFRHFWSVVPDGGRFVAITDPGSAVADLAHDHGFQRTFYGDPEIGGRYSALSAFGLVPAALMGADVRALLDGAEVAEQACAQHDSTSHNSGLWLGLAIGELALQGRDKLTFVVPGAISSFGLWVEQLIAESTGKQGKGIVPVVGEPLGEPADYGHDRTFVYLRDESEPDADVEAKIAALAKAGHPTITLSAHGAGDLGRIFFFAEFAVAVAGWVLGINPFDQPNVQEAKDNTKRVLESLAQSGALPEVPDASRDELHAVLGTAAPPDYIAILGFLAPSSEVDAAVAELRETLRAATGCATTFGYGPRYLHSTGQLHKGGPPRGRFLQLIHDPGEDVPVPEAGYTFTTLKHAQAIGDLQTLRGHRLPAERVTLQGGDAAAAIRALTTTLKELI
jgi:transaldolase / glucose-6-phosphate isomerase